MYYEEKLFNGYWWFRNEQYGAWYKFTYEQLLHKCIKLEKAYKSEVKRHEMNKSINS